MKYVRSIVILSFFTLLLLSFVHAQSLSVTLTRTLNCNTCVEPDVPELTVVNLTITATPDEDVLNAGLDDFFPSDWTVVDANGGTVSTAGSGQMIQWELGTLATAGETRWYTAQSPLKTNPVTTHNFVASVRNGTAWWNDSGYGIDVSSKSPIQTQAQYVWLDADDVAITTEDVPYTTAALNTGYHARIGVSVSNEKWQTSQVSLWLGDSSCNTFSTEITTTSTPAAYWDDPDHLGGTVIDSTVLSSSNTKEDYLESEPSGVMRILNKGKQGEWDFALTFTQSGTYYLCMREHGSLEANLDAYTQVPTITVVAPNSAPVITSADDASAVATPTNADAAVTFTTQWMDASDSVQLQVCKTNALTGTICDAGAWCESVGFTSTTPVTCAYTTTESDVASNDWYAFVCDDEALCSSAESTNSPFEVNHRPIVVNVSATPVLPTASDTLSCGYTYNDLDADAEFIAGALFNWYLQDEGVGNFNLVVSETSSTLSPGNFDGNDNLYCEVSVMDEHNLVAASYVASSQVTIQENAFCDLSLNTSTLAFGGLDPGSTSLTEHVQLLNNGTVAGNITVQATDWSGPAALVVSATEVQGGDLADWTALALTDLVHKTMLLASAAFDSNLRLTIPANQAAGAYTQTIVYTVAC